MIISNFTAYVKQLWRNKPDTSTPLSADRLTHIEEGIKGNSDAIEKIAAAVINQITNDPDKIASMAALYAVNRRVDEVNSNIIASEKKNVSGLNSFSLGGDYYVRKYSNGLGVAVFTNIIIPQITTNGWIEMVRLPFTMLENAAFRVNLSRGGTHAGIRDAIFTGTVFSAYLTTADSGAEISINAAINLAI